MLSLPFCHSNLPLLLNIERVTSAKLLGIISSSLFEIRPQGSTKQYTVNIKTDTERKENTLQ